MLAAGSFLLMMTMGMMLDIFGNDDDEAAQADGPDFAGGSDLPVDQGDDAVASLAANDSASAAGDVGSMATILDFAAYAQDATEVGAEAGTEGDDILTGTEFDDVIAGLEGDDQLTGGDGDDVLLGGAGADILSGGAGQDSLYGGEGADTLNGEADDDQLLVGSGDTATGGEGADQFILGSWLVGEGAPAAITDYDPDEDQLVVVYDPETGPAPEITVETDAEGAVTGVFGDGVPLANVAGWSGASAADIAVVAQSLDAF